MGKQGAILEGGERESHIHFSMEQGKGLKDDVIVISWCVLGHSGVAKEGLLSPDQLHLLLLHQLLLRDVHP